MAGGAVVKHWLINVTWRCQNRCSYCWLNNSIRTRPEMLMAQERSAYDWAKAIERNKIDLVDIAGGEPLLVPWVPMLISEMGNTIFGLSTNGLDIRAVRKLASLKPTNLIAVNVSYHPDTRARVQDYNARWQEAVHILREAKIRVHCNLVDYSDNRGRSADMLDWLRCEDVPFEISPYEEVCGLDAKLELGLCCLGGATHMTVAPDGSAWPCLTTLRSPYWRETCIGNWVDGTTDLLRKQQPCFLNCTDYYVLKNQHAAGDMWGTDAKPYEEGA